MLSEWEGRLERFLERNTIAVHAGAHKTATSYIQVTLSDHRNSLEADGALAILLRADLRRQKPVHRAVGGIGTPTPVELDRQRYLHVIAEALKQRDAVRHICISEENIIGSPGDILRKGSLYRDLRQRLARLPRLLDHPNVTFFISLRDYASFFSSCVTTAARRGSVFPPEDLRLKLLLMPRTWIEVVSDLATSFPAARLKIWDYACFKSLEAEIFRSLVGQSISSRHGIVHRTLSAKAMDKALRSVSTVENTRRVVRAAMTAHPIGEANPPFMLFSPEEQAILDDLYAEDLATLRRDFRRHFLC